MTATKSMVKMLDIMSDSFTGMEDKFKQGHAVLSEFGSSMQSYIMFGTKIGEKSFRIDIDDSNVTEFINAYKKLDAVQQESAMKMVNILDEEVKQAIIESGIEIQNNTKYTVAQTAATTVLNGVIAVTKQLLTSIAIGIAVAAITKLVDVIANLETEQEKLKNKLEKVNDELSDNKSKIDSVNSKLEELNQKIKEAGAESISDIVDPNERERLQGINDDLEAQLELYKEIEAYKSNEKNETAFTIATSATEESLNPETYTVKTDQYGNINDNGLFEVEIEKKITQTESLNEWTKKLDDLNTKYTLSAPGSEERENLRNQIDETMDKITDLSTKVSENRNEFSESASENSKYTEQLTSMDDAISGAAESMKVANQIISGSAGDITSNASVLKEALSEGLNSKDNNILNLLEEIKDFSEYSQNGLLGLNNKDILNRTGEQQVLISDLNAVAKSYGVTLETLLNILAEYGYIQNSANISATDGAAALENLNTKIDSIQSAYGAMTTAVEEYNTYGYMTADSLQALIALGDDYVRCLEFSNGVLKINNDAYRELIVAQYEEMKITALNSAITQLNAIAKGKVSESSEGVQKAKNKRSK